MQFGIEGSRCVRLAVWRPQPGFAHDLKKRRLANRRLDQRFKPHKHFVFLRQGLIELPEIVAGTARYFATVFVGIR